MIGAVEKRRSQQIPWTLGAAALLVLAGLLWLLFTRLQGPPLPALLAPALPPQCQQVVLVLAPDDHAVQARLWLLQRAGKGPWRAVSDPIPCTLGHKGLAWGAGEHTSAPPPGFRIKREGDKCSPAGVFRLPFAFGLAGIAPELKLPYTPLTPTIIGVDDPKSRYYNQVVDNTKVERDWDSNEPMVRHDRLYQWGAFIAHNPGATPGLGSCIFLHLWPGPGRGTAGCTAMAETDLYRVLTWLDPALEPRLVQGVEGW